MSTETSKTPPKAVHARRSPQRGNAGRPNAAVKTPAKTNPVLEQLAALYPPLFGANFLPLKRGIFQDLMAAHPDLLERDSLKAALAWHTRSTRYLAAMAAGQPRHDLTGQAVEALAPEHVQHALLEVFKRRQARTPDDLRPKLRARFMQVFQASGLSREEYAEKILGRDELAQVLWQELLAELDVQAAKDEALKRAFDASGQSLESFAAMYGMEPGAVAQALARTNTAPTRAVGSP